MTEITQSISRGIRPEVARLRIEAFRKRFKEAHFYFAQHAAFPLALTPDLLYRLRENFQRTSNDEQLDIPWVAIADLLLSPLCEEVDSGYELYEMDVTVRAQLLKELQANPNFGDARIRELADFLQSYAQEQLTSSDPTLVEIAQSQTWTALAYTQPGQAAQELAALVKLFYDNDSLEQVRIASLMETLGTLAEPLARLDGFEPLLTYAQEQAHTILGHTQVEDAPERIKQATTQVAQTLGVNLPTNRVASEASEEPASSTQQATRTTFDFYISHHVADHDKAEQIAQQLQAAGYTVNSGFEFGPASSLDIDTGSIRNQARHTIALLSPDYLNVDNVQQEWKAILVQSQQQEQRLLLPIRIRECTPQGIFASIQYLDLVGQDEEIAREMLLQFVRQSLSKPASSSTVQYKDVSSSENSAKRTLTVFVSYAPKDEALFDQLLSHLSPLQNQGMIEVWSKNRIISETVQEISEHLDKAQIVLLLVSPSFLVSDQNYFEMLEALERHRRNILSVIPILLRATNLTTTPLVTLQALPRNGRPVVQWSDIEDAFINIVEEIRRIVEKLNEDEPPVSVDDESKIRELERRVRIDPDAETYVKLGNLYERLRRIDEAIRAYEGARSLQPSDVDVLFALSRLYNDTGAHGQAIEILNQLITLQPDFADAYQQRGLLYRREADAEYAAKKDDEQRSIKYKQAVADLERAIELRPNFEEALGTLGGLYRRLEDYEQAVKYYQSLYNVNKSSSYALGNLGSLSWYLGQREEARNYFTLLKDTSQTRLQEEAPQIQSQVVRGEAYWDYYDLALSQLATGEVDAAKETYAKAIEETPAIEQFGAVLNNLYFLQRAQEPIQGLEEIIALIEKAKDKMGTDE